MTVGDLVARDLAEYHALKRTVCPCGHEILKDKQAAQIAARKISERREARAFQCNRGWWHIGGGRVKPY